MRLLKCFILLCFIFLSNSGFSQKRELRGVWLTTFSNIDWPQRNQSPEMQRAELIRILDAYKTIGFNTIYFQVRSQSDAMYQSDIEPWSADLTGAQGKAPEPFWDPLSYIIDEAHKRGMELHAWINPYRAVANINALPYFSPEHIAKKKPGLLLTSGTLRILNPAKSEVRQHVINVISDIVSRYDVDGIHFDDYFYPEGTLNDRADFTSDNRGFSNIADWRRDNVNLLIRDVSMMIRQTKPWVKFGVSPSGIYQNSSNPLHGTPTTGLQHYSELFSDSRKWINEGWVDYLAPQVYWHYNQPGSPYKVVTEWWNDQAAGRHIYIGIAGYKVNTWPGWNSHKEIPQQVRLASETRLKNIYGVSIYNTRSLLENKNGFKDSLVSFFSKPVLQPLMPWKDSIPPPAPQNLRLTQQNGMLILKWDAVPEDIKSKHQIAYHAVYRSSSYPVTMHEKHLYDVVRNANEYIDLKARTSDSVYYYLITALDRLQNESSPSNTVNSDRRDLPIVEMRIYRSGDGSYNLSWKDSKPLNASRYVLERSADNHNYQPYLDLGNSSPVRLPRLDQLEGSTWLRIRREGLDAVAYSEAYFYEVKPPIAVVEQPVNNSNEQERDVSESTADEKPKIVKEEIQVAKEAPQHVPNISKTPVTPPVKEPEVVQPPVKEVVTDELPDFAIEFLKPETTGEISKPILTLNKGNSLRINILIVGEVAYQVFDPLGNKIVAGKIWSRSPSAYATIPSSNTLAAGTYYIYLESGDKEDGWIFEVK